MIVGAVCMSHSPLLDRNRAEASVEVRWGAAVEQAQNFAARKDPDFCIVFYPDHLNGFLYNLLPAFCIGVAGNSLGDFGSVPGRLDIPENLAASLVAHCLKSGIDVAQSYDMQIDHGAAQPFELLSRTPDGIPVIPIFINCAAPPRPSFERARALGAAVGAWAASLDERVLIIGSGGLSHDPPLPTLAKATGAVADRLRKGGVLSHASRSLRQRRTYGEGAIFSRGDSTLRALNPEWDRQVLDAYASGDLASLDQTGDDAITEQAGVGAHELRCWTAALSALCADDTPFEAVEHFYEPIDEWLTGMAILTASSVATN
jgi:2,3-dihydroxyphenylpropionate 1,2-dioxygenase